MSDDKDDGMDKLFPLKVYSRSAQWPADRTDLTQRIVEGLTEHRMPTEGAIYFQKLPHGGYTLKIYRRERD